MANNIRVLMVEDHEMTRIALSLVLEREDSIELIDTAEDGLAGINKAKLLNPDIVLMDIGLPEIDGIEATKLIKEYTPEVKVLMYTSRDREEDVLSAFESGADGYIMKGATKDQTISAIKAVAEGIGLTDRELEVLGLIVNGLSNREIADELVISYATAKAHVHSILQKLCTENRTKAINLAMKEGLV